MDIRCERCQTEYEFDETKVTEAGVTVKCTNCGNLFRVRRRAEAPTAVIAAPSKEKVWMVRSRDGDLRRFRELTTLQQWIVESRVARDDEISLTGETWKRLGDIAELASFFHVVEQAKAAAAGTVQATVPQKTAPLGAGLNPAPPAPAPAVAGTAAPIAFARTLPGMPAVGLSGAAPAPYGSVAAAPPPAPPPAAPPPAAAPAMEMTADVAGTAALDAPTGPISIGATTATDEPAFTQAPLVGAADVGGPAWEESDGRRTVAADDEDLADEVPRRKPGKVLLYGLLGVIALAVGIVGARYWTDIKASVDKGPTRADDTYRTGRELFLLDTDESFDRAKAAFNQADSANDQSSLALAALSEMYATRAFYLLDDAKLAAEAGDAAKSAELKRGAQLMIDEARRCAIEAARRPNATEVPEVQRAWGALRLVSGSPAVDVEADLAKVRAKRPDDPETLFVEGALRLREGQVEEARRLLGQAIQRHKAQTQKTLLRAQYLLARLERDAGRKAEARALLEEMLKVNDKHLRARRLLDALGRPTGPVPPSAPDAAPMLARPVDAGLAAPGREPPGALGPTGGDREPGGGSYEALVSRAEKLQRSGASGQALKLFEKALAERPNGVEALTGLAYCHLDANRFQAAISAFRRALDTNSRYGEAVIGLAEAYKQSGDKARALEQYKRYRDLGGGRRREAEVNIQALEAAVPKPVEAAPPKPIEAVTPPEATKPPEKAPEKPAVEKPPEQAPEKPAAEKPPEQAPEKAPEKAPPREKPTDLPEPPKP
jgi:predicted Zn finger-like uncharacterized protein